jgi:hypothetical protein
MSAYGDVVERWDEIREEYRSIGQTIRATAKPGDTLVLEHFGTTRRVKVIAVSKTRLCFEYTAPSSGITRQVWVKDVELSAKARDRREGPKATPIADELFGEVK